MSSDTPNPVAAADLRAATVEMFAPVVEQTFEAVFTNGRLPLTLVGARSLGAAHVPGGRPPFALTFRGQPELRLPQRIYRLEHPTFGALDIFLVQSGAGAEGSMFEAVFN